MWSRIISPPHRLIGAAFVMAMAVGGALLLVQFTGVAWGFGPDVRGVLGAVSAAPYTMFCLFSGRLVDRFRPRHATRLAVLLLMVVWWAMARAGGIRLLMGLAVVNGALLSLFWPSIMVWLASLTSGGARELGRVLALFNFSWSGGFLLGAIVVGMLWEWMGCSAFYYSVGIALVILLLLQFTPSGWQARSDHPQEAGPEERDEPRPGGRRLLLAARIALFASFFATSTISALFPKFGDLLGYSGVLIGWSVGVPYLSAMVIFAASRTTTRWHYHSWKLWLAVPVGLTGIVLATRARNPGQFITAFMLVGICVGVSYLASQFYGLHGAPERRGRNMGYNEAILGAGVVLGPLLGGHLADYTGQLQTAFTLAGAVMLLAGLAQLVVWSVMARRA